MTPSPQLLPYSSWPNCLRLFNNEIDLIATTDVGPRIIRFGFIGGQNEFIEYPEQQGVTGSTTYRSYGGHRLWVAPETQGWTNHPDNNPVEWKQDGSTLILKPPVEPGTHLQKEMRIRLDPDRNHVHITHQITNHHSLPQTLAPWAISVMAPGGCAILPQEPFQPHAERVLPVRPFVLWGYTQMADPRWTWGNQFVRVRQDPNATTPQKIGARVTAGWAAYVNGDRLYIKKFAFDPVATYPDFGCNAEVFTNPRMLEVESLGALKSLARGESVTHEEDWYLFRGIKVGESEQDISSAIAAPLQDIGL
ncbi:MAG: hypothetical protein WBD36_12405 [Bacteroidota bacterium]